MLICFATILIWSHVVQSSDIGEYNPWTTFYFTHNCTNVLEYQCSPGGKCIPPSKVCDDVFDCPDKSDEDGCDYILCKLPRWYHCHNSTRCLSSSFRCDGHYDCPANDDEENCVGYLPHHEVTDCPADEFTCASDGLCLPRDKLCDGQLDCIDGSDEKNCELRNAIDGKEFMCNNKKRLTSMKWVCDGQDDCGDGSDEMDCPYNCTIGNHKFLCKDNRTCISTDKVCNRVVECPDASDEGGECMQHNNNTDCPVGHCPSNAECFVWPSGPVCRCPSGHDHNKTTNTCEDINECQEFGRCSQGCINTLGSNLTNALLLYAGKTSVRGVVMTADTREHQFLVTNETNHVVGITYDGRYVYWTDVGTSSESIVRSQEDGSDLEVLLTAGLSSPEDVAIDYITGNFYITDRAVMHIAVCSNDGRFCTSLVDEIVHKPRSIALYPQAGRMYWTDWGDHPMIATSQMDGSGARPLVTENIHWPNGVAIDWPNKRVYWTDASLKRIESVNFDGQDRHISIEDVLKFPYGIAVFGNNIYWSDGKTMSIQKCNKFNCKEREIIAKDQQIYDIHIYHQTMQPKHANACLNNKCSHLCLLSGPTTFSCECPEGMVLSANQQTCRSTRKPQSILVGLSQYLITLEHRSFGRQEPGSAKALSMHIDKMAYNTLTGDVFIVDNTLRTIYSVNIRNAQTRELVSRTIGNISSLSFDELGNNLFWTDSDRGTIEVLSLRTMSRAIIFHYMAMAHPVAMIAISDIGQLLVVYSTKYGHSASTRMAMNGRGAHYLYGDNLFGYGDIEFTLDQEHSQIYWSDNELQKICFSDYEGRMNHTFTSDIDQPYSLAVLDDDVFWTTVDSTRLHWATKHHTDRKKKLALVTPAGTTPGGQMHILAIAPTVSPNHICNPLGLDKMPCSHICVPLGQNSYGCVCPIGMVFKDNQNSTCINTEFCDFRCRSGECLAQSRQCDGRKDCVDESDELDCSAHGEKVTSCGTDQFKCADASACIPIEQRCNLNYDCPDKSDEMHCKDYNKTTGCHSKQYKCSDGNCIDMTSRCDGVNDCSDGADELNCSDGAKGDHCKAMGMFRCASRQCVPTAWKCDGIPDCVDGSDERDCPYVPCPKSFFKCKMSHHCIDPQLVCDGINHCGDNSDELSCKQLGDIVCSETQFQCASNKSMCLDKRAHCNGTIECPRGEDEADCSDCRTDEFQCANKKCIPMRWRCDQANDCYDNSDELGCGQSISGGFHRSCQDHQFDCKDGTCLDDPKMMCDGHKDCANGLDESGVCEVKCESDMCQHFCHRTPYGPTCTCREGYILEADKKSCIDRDECKDYNPCAQECTNTEGGFRCSCFNGYMLRSDKTTCKAVTKDKFMLYNSFDTIFNITSKTLEIVWSSNGSRIIGMDLDIDKNLLYFTLEGSSSLFEMDLHTRIIRFINQTGNPSKLAVDWVTNNVYLVDDLIEHTIKICHMDEQVCINLVHFNFLEAVRSLVVDPVHNLLFYTLLHYSISSSPRSTIYSHALDGTRMALLVREAAYISDLVYDSNKQLLFYAEMSTASIWSIQYDGSMKRQLMKQQTGISKPNSIMLAEDQVYVLNVGSNIAAHCKVYDNRECKSFDIAAFNADNIVGTHAPSQKILSNECADHKCKTAICVIAERGPKCLCNSGLFVDPGVHCKDVQKSTAGHLNPPKKQEATSTTNTATISSVFKVIWTVIGVIIILTAMAGGIYWTYMREYRRRNWDLQLRERSRNEHADDDDRNRLFDENSMHNRLIRHNST